MKNSIIALLLLSGNALYAQFNIDTLAIQDFEVIPMTPVWTFTGPVVYNSGTSAANAAPPNSPIGINNSRAWESTTQSSGLILDFANVVIPGIYDSIRVKFRLAAMNLSGTSGGPDDLDYVLTEVSLDGGMTYYNKLRIRGAINNNSFWPYSATGLAKVYYQPQTEIVFQPVNSGLQTTEGYSSEEITFPGTVTQVKIRMTGRSSSSTDTWLVDNVMITGENNTPSSVTGPEAKVDIALFPNPCTGSFTIHSFGSGITSVSVTDIAGRLISISEQKNPTGEWTLELPASAKGIYFARIETANGITVKKIIAE